MNLFDLVYSRLGPALGIVLARLLTEKQIFYLAERLSVRAARQTDSPVIRAIRSNQAVARGLPLSDPELHLAVIEVLQNAARSYAALFRTMAYGVEALEAASTMDDRLWDHLKQARKERVGVIAVGAHMAGFEFFLLSLKSRGLSVQAISAPYLRGSYRILNFIRRRYGLDITPISFKALRKAIRQLRDGGMVLTGIDFPVRAGDGLRFLGRRTRLPLGYARLAVRTGAPMFVALCHSGQIPGTYHADISELLYPERTGDERSDVLRLARRALARIEAQIQARPGEWMMFHPLWPEVAGNPG